MSSFKRPLTAGLILLFLGATLPAAAQQTGHTVTVEQQGMSSMDYGFLGLNSLDRTILGARARGMGGAFLAMPGNASSAAGNPGALTSVASPELSSESRYRSGSANGLAAPPTLLAPGFGALPVSEYRPGLQTSYTYNDLSYAMPLVLLGRRAGVGLSYRRMIDVKTGEETRFKVQSPQGEADFGQGVTFNGGVNAFSPVVALSLADRVSVGATLNFMSGTVTKDGNQGVTSFGFVVASGDMSFEQEVHGTSLDLGTRVELGDLSIGGLVQTGHTLKFRDGSDRVQPLPDVNQPPGTPIIILERTMMDHDLSVPTNFGVGLAYTLMNDRMTLAADYWNRSWSSSEITRNGFDLDVIYPDSTNSLVYVANIVPNSSEYTKDAALQDTHHFRFGVEWLAKKGENGGMQIPIRLGFRSEPLTFSNMDTTAYDAAYKQVLDAAALNVPAAEREAAVTEALDYLYNNASILLSGSDVTAAILTAGTGISVGTFSAEFAVSRTSYTVERVFLGSFADFTRNPDLDMAKEDRNSTEFTFTLALRF